MILNCLVGINVVELLVLTLLNKKKVNYLITLMLLIYFIARYFVKIPNKLNSTKENSRYMIGVE